ncbi:MAG: ParB/RepB/Spo0J family partition protein [Alphaproteobacteria bacterium]|nr:ParB/RepB/Spo0J family partition protein [Alphaproteobacteria bacterium]
MSKEPIKPRGLGRGLAALLGDDTPAPAPDAVEKPAAAPTAPPPAASAPAVAPTGTLPIEWLQRGKYQPRLEFSEEGLAQLTESIAAHGLVQPILVRPQRGPDGAVVPQRYEIVAGERRWRAAQRAQLHEVPVVIKTLADRDALEIALIENVQRADLSPIEEATAYRRLQSEFGHTQERIGATVGKSRAHVANTLRLLELPPDVVAMLTDRRLDAGQARALLGTKDPTALARFGLEQGLSTREFERLGNVAKEAAKDGWDGKGVPPGWNKSSAKPSASSGASAKPATTARAGDKDADTMALERTLTESLGLRVEIDPIGSGEETRMTIHLEHFDQLDMVVQRLTRK